MFSPPVPQVNPPLDSFITWLDNQRVVGFDIETDGLRQRCTINCIQVGAGDDVFIITEDLAQYLWALFTNPTLLSLIHI